MTERNSEILLFYLQTSSIYMFITFPTQESSFTVRNYDNHNDHDYERFSWRYVE